MTQWWRWLLAVFFLLAGFVAVGDWGKLSWLVLTLSMYAVPALLQFLPFRAVQIYGLWFGGFLILQTVVSALVGNADYFTLEPSLRLEREVYPGVIPGIEGILRISTDEKGFRTTRRVDYAKKPVGSLRLFAIGASTTEQIFLDDKLTWTHLLQVNLQERFPALSVEVINTGVSGLRVKHHIATLQHIASYEPDVALFVVGINDWNRHVIRSLAPELLNKTGPRQERERKHGLAGVMYFRQTLLGNFLDRAALRILTRRDSARVRLVERGAYLQDKGDSLDRAVKISFKPTAVSSEYAADLEDLERECRELEIICMFATQPTGYRMEAPQSLRQRFWMTPPYSEFTLDFDSLVYLSALYNDYLLDFAERRGFPTCDLAVEITASPEFFYDDCHFTVAGARKVSNSLTTCLTGVLLDRIH